MKINVSDYYKDRVKNAYVTTHKDGRKVCVMAYHNGEKHSMSYAKYLYTSFYQKDVEKGIHVDHINGDKTDDRIENLQEITMDYNIKKDHLVKELVEVECPVCGTHFWFEKRNLCSHPNPCCSRRCGGIKSHWK